jgi:hypothetical protein|tara:strand:- start:186 stop:302 length:117 start_codon:yes stop_codon:yes gene_type:complete
MVGRKKTKGRAKGYAKGGMAKRAKKKTKGMNRGGVRKR